MLQPAPCHAIFGHIHPIVQLDFNTTKLYSRKSDNALSVWFFCPLIIYHQKVFGVNQFTGKNLTEKNKKKPSFRVIKNITVE